MMSRCDDQFRGIVAALSGCRHDYCQWTPNQKKTLMIKFAGLLQRCRGVVWLKNKRENQLLSIWDSELSVRTIIIIVVIMIHGAVIICRYTCTLFPDRMHMSGLRGVCVPAACTHSFRKIANRNVIVGSGMVLVRLSGRLSAWCSPSCTGVQHASFL